MREWLTKHEIPWNSGDLKRDFFCKNVSNIYQKKVCGRWHCKGCGPQRSTPIAHCELNPIELVWASVKNYLRKHNTTFRLSDLKELLPLAFNNVTPEIWLNCCRKAGEVEQRYWRNDGLQEDAVEQVLIDLGEKDDSSSEESSTDDSETDSEVMDKDDRKALSTF